MNHEPVAPTVRTLPGLRRESRILRSVRKRWQLYVMLLLPIAWYITFQYIPMYGVQIAFKDFLPTRGIMDSPWVGFKHIFRFFSSYYALDLLRNTITISLYSLIVGFPIPIMLAIIVNEIQNNRFKKVLQNVTYIPNFLSVVVVVGMIYIFLNPEYGLLNKGLVNLGLQPVAFMERPEWFKTVYVLSGVWQTAGWESIIYIAALAGIDPSLYEAASVDGASRWQRIRAVAIPSIMPTIIILFILKLGQLMNVGFEKVLLMQNGLNMSSSDIISTFIYRYGVQQGEYSYTSAIGLFNSVINFVFLLTANKIAKRNSDTSLF